MCGPLGSKRIVADDFRHTGDAFGGERLLCDGVDPVKIFEFRTGIGMGETAARGVVHAALNATPEIPLVLMNPACGNHALIGKDAFLETFEPVVMLLKHFGVLENVFEMFAVSGHEGVFIFRPCEKRGIVGMLDEDRRAVTGLVAGPGGFAFRDFDERKTHAVLEHVDEVAEGFDAREVFRGELAEQSHETGVPDPDSGFAERLVDVGILRHAGDLLDVVFRKVPREVVKLNVFRMFIEHRVRDMIEPVFPHDRLLPLLNQARTSAFSMMTGSTGTSSW